MYNTSNDSIYFPPFHNCLPCAPLSLVSYPIIAFQKALADFNNPSEDVVLRFQGLAVQLLHRHSHERFLQGNLSKVRQDGSWIYGLPFQRDCLQLLPEDEAACLKKRKEQQPLRTISWTKIGKPTLAPASCRYEVANGQPLATLGTFQTVVSMQGEKPRSSKIQFTVSKTPRLNLLGQDAIVKLGVDIPALLGIPSAD